MASSCPICEDCSPSLIHKINAALKAGQAPEEIGLRHGVPYGDIIHHQDVCLRPPPTHLEILQTEMSECRGLCELSRSEYQRDPTSDKAFAYTALARELRENLAQIDSIWSGDDIIKDLVSTVFNPMLTSLVHSAVSEVQVAKDNLTRVPGQQNQMTERELGELTTRLAQRFKTVFHSGLNKIRAYYGIEEVSDGTSATTSSSAAHAAEPSMPRKPN